MGIGKTTVAAIFVLQNISAVIEVKCVNSIYSHQNCMTAGALF